MNIVQPSYEILTQFDGQELLRIERAARTCYKSENRITDGSAAHLVENLIRRGHEAMLEFGTLAVKFVCDRGISHELVRHRLCSFAQESTRYCDYGEDGEIQVICPVELRDVPSAYDQWWNAVYLAEEVYQDLRGQGVPPQIARSVLPICLKTEIVMQGNFREWRHIFQLRTTKAAHPQMRELMVPLLRDMQRLVPVIFDDIEVL
jgi:thymidylate synthase (FAD)